jgi:hypothetical protein
MLVPDPNTAWIVQWIFELRDTRGWGGQRIAKMLNKDPRIIGMKLKFYGCTVDYILENQIYGGTLVLGANNVDIVDDVRVVRPAENPEDILVVPEFCEPLIEKERYQRVRGVTQARKNAHKARKAAVAENEDKLIRPLTPGISLVHPLAGMVCCGHCGSAMNARASGRTSKSGTRYTYYVCVRAGAGVCTNRRNVRENELWAAVISRLRGRLFPASGVSGDMLGWLPELVAVIERELAEREAARPARAAQIPELVKAEQDKILGWMESLSSSSIQPAVREIIQQRMNESIFMVSTLKDEAAREEAIGRQMRHLVDPERVLEKLQQLDAVLADTNVNSVNLELARHIDRIECHSDGRVLMVGTHVGLLDGAIDLLTANAAGRPPVAVCATESEVTKVVPRRRSPRRTAALTGADNIDVKDAWRAIDPARFAGLPEKFLWTETFIVGRRVSWAEENAPQVLAMRQKDPKISFAKLGEHFGTTPATVRRALRIAMGLEVPKSQAMRVPRSREREPDTRDPAELAKMIRLLYDEGKFIKEIEEELDVPSTRLHDLLEKTFTDAGEVMPDNRARRMKLTAKQTNVPKYKQLAEEVHTLKQQGVSCEEIGRKLGLDPNSLVKSRRFWAESHGEAFIDGRKLRRKEEGK